MVDGLKRLSVLAVALVMAATLFFSGRSLLRPQAALALPPAAFDVAECTTVVNPGESIQTAVTGSATGATVCVRGGVYNERITIRPDKANLRLVAWPGETPVIDGDRALPGGAFVQRFDALVTILASGAVLDGFEITGSTGDGVDVTTAAGATQPIQGVTVRNSHIHNNWGPGLIARGNVDLPAANILIENNRVHDNLRRARLIPVIYRGLRSGTGPADWTFERSELWDAPFWSGMHADLPETWLNGIAMTFNDDGRTSRVYAGSARQGRAGFIGADYSATGAQFTYSGSDLLFHDPLANKWTLFFDGDFSHGLPAVAVIDAFQIEGTDAPPECPACAPIVMSFATTTTVPISGTATAIGPSDLVRFAPTAVDAYGAITAGGYTLFRLAADMNLPPSANIDALDRAPDGRFLASFAGNVTLGGQPFNNEDLVAYDESSGVWSLYFDGDQVPFNPFFDDLTAAWLDRQGNLYVSGDPVGGAALTFIFAENSIARGNYVYNNHGEGLVADRYTARITLEDNVTYDNAHANLYLNATAYPLVQRNLVFCTDDREFWRKGSTSFYRPGPGIQVRDEDFEGQPVMPPSSIGQVIINNVVIGCSTNFGVSTQQGTGVGGLRDALVANNTFANARGDGANSNTNGVNNVEFNQQATYTNTRFVNNLILQQPAGQAARVIGTARAGAFNTLTMAGNLYSISPHNSWPGGESGRVVAAPQFAAGDPPLPVAGAIPDAGAYRLSYTSPAFEGGIALSEVSGDYFSASRDASGLPDIGAHELPHIGAIIVALETLPGRFTQTFDFTTSYAPNGFQLQGGQTSVTEPLEAGLYSVAVAAVDGWAATATCDDGSPPDAIVLGPTERVTCTFRGERQTRLTVSNAIDPAGGAPLFDFSLSPGDPFQLAGESRTFTLAPGQYALTAAPPEGWQQSVSCDNGANAGALDLAAGDWVACTFSHRKLGRIIIEKQTLPDGATQTFAFSASYDGDGFTLGDSQRDTSAYLSPAVYAVAETLPDGWAQAGATCDDGSPPDAIDLSAGETVTCVFTNVRLGLDVAVTPDPAQVTAPGGDVVYGVSVTNTSPVAVELASLVDSVYGDIAGAANAALKSTTCSLPQSLNPGAVYNCVFTATVTGTGGSAQTNTVTAIAAGPAGATVSGSANTSVFVNVPPPGRIIVIKQTSPAGAAASFTFTADYNPTGFSLSHGQSNDSGPLPAGATYSVAESVPLGWAQASATCDDGSPPGAISVSAAETVTCTFVNARLGLSASLTPTPSSVTAPGGDVSFAVAVTNSGAAGVQLTGLTDSVYGNVASAANPALKSTTCSLPQSLVAGGSYTCAYTATVSGSGGTSQANTLMASATGPGGSSVGGAATASVAINPPPAGRIIVTKVTDPANTPGSFSFAASYAPAGFSLSHGQSHDSGPLPPGAYSVSESVPAGWTLVSAVCTGDDDGTSPASIQLDPNETVTCTFTNRRTTSAPLATIYVAAAAKGTVRGIPYAVGDILAYDGRTDTWSLYFDGSNVGWTRAVSDFVRLPDGSLLLVAGARLTLGSGTGRFTLEVQDIARFVPRSLGDNTDGTFSLYFDGSDVALSTSGERIDALAVKSDGTLLISTIDRATVKNGATSITAQDEDLLAFRPTSLEANTGGVWSLLPDGFDGSLLTGMAAEDVTGAWYDDATGDLYLTITNAFKVGGVSGNQRTVLRVTPGRAVSVYWNANTAGFPGGLDALFIAP